MAPVVPIDSRDGLLHIPQHIKDGIWTTRCGFNVDESQRKAWHRLPIAGGRTDCTCRTCSDSLELLASSPAFLYDTIGMEPVLSLAHSLTGFQTRMLQVGKSGPSGYFSQWFIIESAESTEAGRYATAYRSSMVDVNREYERRAQRIKLVHSGTARARKLQESKKQANDELGFLRLNCRVIFPAYVLLSEDLNRWDGLIRSVPQPA